MAYAAPNEDTVHFVGGAGTQADIAALNGGGVTKAAWDNDPALLSYMGANGGPKATTAVGVFTTATKNFAATNIGLNVTAGTLAYVSTGDGAHVTAGVYEITTVTDNDNIIMLNIDDDGTNDTGHTINVGGAFDLIQTAFDEDSTDASAASRYIYTNLDETLTATIDLDEGTGGPAFLKLLIGYKLAPGDRDEGGTYYKDSTDGWTILDSDSGAWDAIEVVDIINLQIRNIKIINVNTSNIALDIVNTTQIEGNIIENVWFTGGDGALRVENAATVIVTRCKFTGTYGTGLADAVLKMSGGTIYCGVVIDSEFDITEAKKIMAFASTAIMAFVGGNIISFAGEAAGNYSIYITEGGVVANNVIYEDGGTLVTAIGNGVNQSSVLIYGNIVVGATTSVSSALGDAYHDYNCFYNCGSNLTIGSNEITTDPLFVDAANMDFRLKSGSPCLNTGRPGLGGSQLYNGSSSMGAWQKKQGTRRPRLNV